MHRVAVALFASSSSPPRSPPGRYCPAGMAVGIDRQADRSVPELVPDAGSDLSRSGVTLPELRFFGDTMLVTARDGGLA